MVFLGLGKRSPNNAVIGDMGWSSCFARQLGEVYRIMLKFTEMENDRINKCVFLWSKSFNKSNEAKFFKLLRKMDIDFSLTGGNSKQSVKDFIKAVDSHEQLEWYSQLWNDKGNEVNGNKLRLYRLHKERINPEFYVLQSMSKDHRKAIAKLRSGTMALYVETGRYNKTPLQQRICTYCESGSIEDEKHFLLNCELYNDIRYDLLKEMCNIQPDFITHDYLTQYCILMTTESIQQLLGKMLVKMYKRRKAFTT